jgi:putative transposase
MTTTTRKPYLTDLTDAQWAFLEPLIPPAKHGGRPREVDMREVLNTLFYLNRTGCQWDLLPHDLLPKSTVYQYFKQWREDGTWQGMMDALRAQVRVADGREPTPSAGSIDSQRLSVKFSRRICGFAHAAWRYWNGTTRAGGASRRSIR